MLERRWRWLLAAGVAAIVMQLALGGVAADLAYLSIGLAAIAVLASTTRRRTSAIRPWRLLTAGVACAVGGDVAWGVYDHVLHQDPYPSVADVLYLLSYVLLGAGLLRLTTPADRTAAREGVLDALTVAVGAGALVWQFLIAPHLDDGVAVVDQTVALAYPVLGVVLLVVAARFGFTASSGIVSQRLAVAAILATLAADTVYAWLAAADTYGDGHLVDAGWLLGYVFWAVAAVHPDSDRLGSGNVPRQALAPSAGRLVLLAVACVAPLVVALVQDLRGEDVATGLLLASAVVTAFSLTRIMLLTRSVAGHARRVEELERVESRLLAAAEEAGDRERSAIAADLHDGPVQKLTAMLLHLDLQRSLVPGGAAVAVDGLDRVADTAHAAVRELRAVMAGLWPPALHDSPSIDAAIRSLAEQAAADGGVRTTVDVGSLPALPPARALVLYRVAQEALTNVTRHARASVVSVRLGTGDDAVELAITDDGCGFDVGSDAERTADGHYGLAGMRRRAELAGGQLEVTSHPGRGTTLRLTLPTT